MSAPRIVLSALALAGAALFGAAAQGIAAMDGELAAAAHPQHPCPLVTPSERDL